MTGIFGLHTSTNKTNVEDIFVLDGMSSIHYFNVKLNRYYRKIIG